MRFFWIGAALFCAALMALPSKAEAACPGFKDPSVRVTTFYQPARYNFRTGFASLRKLADQDASSIFHKDQPTGLQTAELSITMTLISNIGTSDDGRFCAYPSELTVDVGFKNNTIYVARELPRRSCPYEEVLAHEEGHAEIDRQLLREFQPRLEQYAQTAVREVGVITKRSVDDAEKELRANLNEKLEALAKEMNTERIRRQSAHDSPEEYGRLSKVCDGQLQEIVGKYRQGEAPRAESKSKSDTRTPQIPGRITPNIIEQRRITPTIMREAK